MPQLFLNLVILERLSEKIRLIRNNRTNNNVHLKNVRAKRVIRQGKAMISYQQGVLYHGMNNALLLSERINKLKTKINYKTEKTKVLRNLSCIYFKAESGYENSQNKNSYGLSEINDPNSDDSSIIARYTNDRTSC